MKSKIVALTENKRRFEIVHPDSYRSEKIHIDGELITDSVTERCDYGVTLGKGEERSYAFLVELKGKELLKAISQLKSTITIMKSTFDTFNHKEAHAVCSKIIPFITSSAQVEAVRFKKLGYKLEWHSQMGKRIITE